MGNKVYYGQYSLRHWVNLILKGNIVLPEYQRSFVWDEGKVKGLISAFLEEQFVPPVTIGAFKDGGVGVNLILDGQQRLTSVFLAYLGLYPDKEMYKKHVREYADGSGDDDSDSGDTGDLFDNILEWNFKKLTDKGRSKEAILKCVASGNYKEVVFDVDDVFFDRKFLGFSYLVPISLGEKEQQRYYSSVFRNINVQGETLLPQESRASLYFLDKDLTGFFDPDFARSIFVKSVGNEACFDFVRCISLLSQYHRDGVAGSVARGSKQKMEKYYEDYIYSVVGDIDGKYGRFSTVFPNREYVQRLGLLEQLWEKFNVKEGFGSIIDLDVYMFGFVYMVLFKGCELDVDKLEVLKNELDSMISTLKANSSHARAPGHLKHLRSRIDESIAVYKRYAF